LLVFPSTQQGKLPHSKRANPYGNLYGNWYQHIVICLITATFQRSTDRTCALDMCNTARSFTHESTTYVIRRLVFLNLGFIDPLSCTPLPSTLLSHHFWVGYKVLVQPQNAVGAKKWQKVVPFEFTVVSLSASPTTCDNDPPDFVQEHSRRFSPIFGDFECVCCFVFIQ